MGARDADYCLTFAYLPELSEAVIYAPAHSVRALPAILSARKSSLLTSTLTVFGLLIRFDFAMCSFPPFSHYAASLTECRG